MLIKKKELQALILTILSDKDAVNLQEIAYAAGLSAASPNDRRAIQRA